MCWCDGSWRSSAVQVAVSGDVQGLCASVSWGIGASWAAVCMEGGGESLWLGFSDCFNFPTKDDWRNPSEYSYIGSGLRWLREYLLHSPGLSIAIPALGCGYGGLDWAVVEGMIRSALGDLENEILLFSQQSRR